MVTEVEYRRVVQELTVLTVQEVATLLAGAGDDPARVRNLLIDYLPGTVTPYLTVAGETAAIWYEDLRSSATGVNGYARIAPLPDSGRFESLARWGVRPLAGQSDSTVLSLVGGGVQRMIAGAGRDTVDVNARADAGRGPIAATSWSRVAEPGACSFCTMLAGRGAVYHSAKSAGSMVSAPGAVAAFHDNCRCIVKPTFYRSEPGTVTGRDEPVLIPFAA